ncbi:MAG TPA: molybdopterin-synthase adenylyltransferase MoeB [Ornithinimicrobium sp.]|uniref:molybdopterin-synthase adenylyltransferase MoeB n=1 Tax=Ornithinimicrobium sp. TaxID=1977084 RepID=UPI002B4A3867|nr:molybdopterin-synthase adenylyltransferase MoeB [Ornithinimicrobium sp.]HKJ11529.1 molybdopterin-synthase adenylyltransferase MoeB [Ornithinimicrobium sp.]
MRSLPPLVTQGPELSPAQLERYSRHLLLPGLGMSGQRRLLNARVCVVGAGGLGSPALLYLAAAGVGHLTVIDHDVVEVSNLQRQVLHRAESVGTSKAESARAALLGLNPGIEVISRHAQVRADTVHDLLGGHDVVVDGTDNFATRYLVNDACVQMGLPLVWGAVLRYDAQVSTFLPPALVPPAEAVQLRDLFPAMPSPEAVPSCAEAGVLGALCGQVGSMMASEVVKLVTGVGEPVTGRVLVIDVASMRTREIPLRPASDREATTPHSPTPSAPSALASASPTEVSGELASLTVLDVREPVEHQLGTIPGALLVPLGELLSWRSVGELQRRRVVVTCKTGPRAERAARHLLELGHGDVRVLSGGMRRWVEEVDPSLPRY